jgi:2,5-diketo-D-gluconate reductase B
MNEHLKSPTLPLGEDMRIDQMGFGTWALTGTSGQAAIEHALEIGYRHLDTADMYHNHERVAAAMRDSGLRRGDIFIVTKLQSRSLAGDQVGPTVDRFLRELQTDYIDLLLIHWPSGSVPLAETLGAMEAARQAGKVKSIGVSNFGVRRMEEALATGAPVVNNQIEYNLNRRPQDVLDYCLAHGVTVTAYSPLERGDRGQEQLVAKLAEQYGGTREQLLLIWLMAKDMIVIPRSRNPQHIEANWGALGWEMEAGDVKRMDATG